MSLEIELFLGVLLKMGIDTPGAIFNYFVENGTEIYLYKDSSEYVVEFFNLDKNKTNCVHCCCLLHARNYFSEVRTTTQNGGNPFF